MTDINPITDLIDLTERLTTVMAAEVALLNDMRPSEIGPLQEEKSALSVAYASAVSLVNVHTASLDDAELAQREVLTEAAARLKQIMAENLRAVAVAKMFNERLIKTLSEAAAEQRPSSGTYTAAGGVAPAVTAAQPNAIALDDRI